MLEVIEGKNERSVHGMVISQLMDSLEVDTSADLMIRCQNQKIVEEAMKEFEYHSIEKNMTLEQGFELRDARTDDSRNFTNTEDPPSQNTMNSLIAKMDNYFDN
ncbi:Uncharacterized protein TCM_003880 [Theobroma cacao]|uniref:Uncharacterized protein n=1 Tax=Theobroma cacao TaxID=3641 RepID=A0A061DQD0_THECC|nr:Uncharacterized protein TCM_003880 [Theobroma cacao]